MECRITTDQGVIRVVHSIAQMVPAEEGALQVTGTLYDVTERPRAADEMRLAQERMTQFARLSTMGEMAAGLAHEINQPLAAITTFSQALQRMIRNPAGAAREEIEEVLEQIAAQALRAGEVIHRLRVFLRNREVRQETVAPGQLIEDTLLFAEPDVRLSNIRVLLDVPRHLPAIDCDPVQIQQVLLNLVRNAIDAMNEAVTGPREIVVAGRLIESGELEISVADHGPGISREVAESFGNPFFTTKPSGTGLGVAISRSILRAHGGRFGHRPTPGGGATVFFTLPPAPGGSDE
jgi:two-component system sensor kinase FixL